MKLRALLVDDEPNNLSNLKFMLENDCDGITVAGTAENAEEARTWLSQHEADIVFLDISMPGQNGFEFLQSLEKRSFKVVFVTAHNEFAMQAIKASAVDYLLKPVRIEELQSAVKKLHDMQGNSQYMQQSQELINSLLKNLQPGHTTTKIALPQLGGISFLDVEVIVSLQADSNYTIIHKQDMRKVIVTRTLKDFEDILDPNEFVRVHKSHIINLRYVKEYSTMDGGVVKMLDGNMLSISRRQLDLFLQRMKAYNVLFFK